MQAMPLCFATANSSDIRSRSFIHDRSGLGPPVGAAGAGAFGGRFMACASAAYCRTRARKLGAKRHVLVGIVAPPPISPWVRNPSGPCGSPRLPQRKVGRERRKAMPLRRDLHRTSQVPRGASTSSLADRRSSHDPVFFRRKPYRALACNETRKRVQHGVCIRGLARSRIGSVSPPRFPRSLASPSHCDMEVALSQVAFATQSP